jgi:hypothetical protein
MPLGRVWIGAVSPNLLYGPADFRTDPVRDVPRSEKKAVEQE